jgi:hypothetical protein
MNMSTPKVPVYTVLIRRDAHTTTPTTVPEHEVAVLQTLFGKENVQNLDGKPVGGESGVGLDKPVGEWTPSKNEFERLAKKYGGNDAGLIVEQVFGKEATRGLDNAMASIAKAAKAESKVVDKK